MNGAALFARLFFAFLGLQVFWGIIFAMLPSILPWATSHFPPFFPPSHETRGESFHLLSRGLEGSEKGGVFVFRGLPPSLPPQGSREKQFWCWRQEGEGGKGGTCGE